MHRSGYSVSVAFAVALGALLIAPVRVSGQPKIFSPTRFADRWTADTLYVGATFRYTGTPPLEITLAWSETSVNGKLYVISPRTGARVFVMTNREPAGTTIDLGALAGFRPGEEVVFEYAPDAVDQPPRYTGSGRPGSRFSNRLTSNFNPNPALRFGNSFSVAGKMPDGRLEFGMEDSNGGAFSDMDFNDIHFYLKNAELLLDMKGAKKRSYVW